MAPRKHGTQAISSRKSRTKRDLSASPDPYQSLVADYLASESNAISDEKYTSKLSLKRKRIVDRATDDESLESIPSERAAHPETLKPQVAYEDFGDENSEDDSLEFEDVDFPGSSTKASQKPSEDLKLVLDSNEDGKKASRQLSAARRQTFTSAHRRLRLALHKMHILALISHNRLRNQWCNDPKLQTDLQKLITPSTRKMFKDNTTQTQWQRSRSFKMGLEKAAETFRDHYEISARGIARSFWSDASSEGQINSVPEDIDLPITKEDFLEIGRKKSGSRDLGAQLFCSMLRSIGLDVRLVCSLQPLPLQASLKPITSTKPPPRVIQFLDTRTGLDSGDISTRPENVPKPGLNSIPLGVRRFGHTPGTPDNQRQSAVATITKVSKKKRFRESPFPIYWVEVFNIVDQKWIPVDPLVLKLIEKPSKFEPPASDVQNNMSYVIAIDEDNFIKDVTRRYVNAYNARTRRYRVEATRDGRQWWERIEEMYRDPLPQDRNQVEDSELGAKEAREPMPRSIVEFKNHPYYALERHLHRNQALHPKRQVGTVSAGTNKQLEPVFRRNDVHTVRSADAWFRLGKQVRFGEEPLKLIEFRKSEKPGQQDEGDNTETLGEVAGNALYAVYQTQEYIPSPIINGIVPKNVYGNIDIYTTSMIPAGGVWIDHPFAVGAAKLLATDWADTVTGFEFRGRTGTAVIKGIVVAGEYHEAIIQTIKSFQYAIEEEELSKRTTQVLSTWKRFLIGLRIRERIKSYHVEGEDLEAAAQAEDNQDSESSYNPDEIGGGFLPSEAISASDIDIPHLIPPLSIAIESKPISKALQDSRLPILSTWGKPLPSLPPQQQPPIIPEEECGGGGFIIEHGNQFEEINGVGVGVGVGVGSGSLSVSGGGFVADDSLTLQNAQVARDELATVQMDSMLPANSDGDQEVDMHMEDVQEMPPPPSSASSLSLPVSTIASSEMGKGSGDSLMSHDPDDDDAEPEWL